MGPYTHCKSSGKTIEQTQNVSFATTFEFVCQPCVSNQEKSRLEMLYLDNKIYKMLPVTKKKKVEYRALKMKRNKKKRRWNE